MKYKTGGEEKCPRHAVLSQEILALNWQLADSIKDGCVRSIVTAHFRYFTV
jgi:hypothetical protein